MKKFLAVFLAVIFLLLSVVEGFSLTASFTPDALHFIDLGDKNYSIPIDLSVPPSSIAGSFGDLNSWEEFLRRSSSEDYSFICVWSNGRPKIAFASPSELYVYRRSYTCTTGGSSHTDYDYELYTYDSFPYLVIQYDQESDKYIPLSCFTTSVRSEWSSLTGTCKKSSQSTTFWHAFIYPTFNTGYSSYVRFLDINSLVLSNALPSSYTLTINYQYSNGTPAADSVTQSLAPGTEYSIPSPEIAGYTPDIPLVTGTMPEEDLTVTVTYAKAFYPLTVQYQYTDGSQAAESVSFQYPLGFVYDIPSPEIEGYQPDKPTIAGEMPGEALEEVVTYSAIPYTLTVQYLFTDGSQAAPDHQEQLTIGSSYSVPSPVIEGYHPNQTAVTGIMPASDVVSTVTYREDSGGSSGPGSSGPGEGGDSGGGDPGGGDGSGDDPFIPVLPPFSGNDPFVIPGIPDFSGYDPFVISEPPGYSGYDPFRVPQLPRFSGYDPFKMPERGGS